MYIFVALVFSLCTFAQGSNIGAIISVGGLNYRITSTSEVEVSNNQGASGNIVIPESVTVTFPASSTFTVTRIGTDAFANSSDLESVSIPNTVTSIGDNAFISTALSSITLPNSVNTVGSYAFNGSSLTSITIGSGITNIEVYAFAGNSSLQSVTINKQSPPSNVQGGIFDDVNLSDVTLFVPAGAIDNYADGSFPWNSFGTYSEIGSSCTPPTITNVTNGSSGCPNPYSGAFVTLSATPSAGTVKWYDSPTGGVPLTDSYPYGLQGNTLYVNDLLTTTTFYAEAFISSACVSTSRTAVTATVTQAPVIQSLEPISICEGSSFTLAPTIELNNTFELNRGGSQETYEWFTKNDDVIIDDANSPTIVVSQAAFYTLQVTNNTGCITVQTFQVTINPLPEAPEAVAQSFSPGATVADLVAIGQGLKWYSDPEDLYSNLSTTTLLATGTYYVSQTDGPTECESPRTAVQITVGTACTSPTLTSVTAAPACEGNSTTIVLSGLLPNSLGTAHYKINNGIVQTISGTSTAQGIFSFPSGALPATANGLVVEVTKISTAEGCETSFTGKTVTLVVSPKPTLSAVSAAPACVGSSTNIVLSGLIPNSFGTAHYKLNNGIVQTISGTSTAQGTFSFPSGALPATANGLVIEVTKISTAEGCETSFTGKTVALVVSPIPTLSTVTAAPTCAGSFTNVVLSGLVANSTGIATYKVGGGPLLSQLGTSDANGTFSFPTNLLPADANGVVIEVTKIASLSGCETNFTNKKVTLVVYPKPTLSTITAAPVAAGNSTTIVLSGMQANRFGTASYTENNGPVQTVSGTTTPQGTFSFTTPVLPLAANGVVIRVLKIVNGNGCETTFKDKSVTLVVTNPNAINRPEAVSTDEATFVLYPNPVNDVLNIEASLGIQSVEILNNIGQQVLTSTQKQINVSHLPSGVYLVRIQDAANNLETKKIIIK
jgi:hypothetical protein